MHASQQMKEHFGFQEGVEAEVQLLLHSFSDNHRVTILLVLLLLMHIYIYILFLKFFFQPRSIICRNLRQFISTWISLGQVKKHRSQFTGHKSQVIACQYRAFIEANLRPN